MWLDFLVLAPVTAVCLLWPVVAEDRGTDVAQDLLPHPLALSKVLSWPRTGGQGLSSFPHIGPGLGFRAPPSLLGNKVVLTWPGLSYSNLKRIGDHLLTTYFQTSLPLSLLHRQGLLDVFCSVLPWLRRVYNCCVQFCGKGNPSPRKGNGYACVPGDTSNNH